MSNRSMYDTSVAEPQQSPPSREQRGHVDNPDFAEHIDALHRMQSAAASFGDNMLAALKAPATIGIPAVLLAFAVLNPVKWAKISKCSHDTALQDIHRLIEKGILSKDNVSGRSTSYSLKT